MTRLILLIICLFSSDLFAHAEGNSFLDITLTPESIDIQWQVELQDLPAWWQSQPQSANDLSEKDIINLANSSLQLHPQHCNWQVTSFSIQNDADGDMLTAHLNTQCEAMERTIDYQSLFELNPLHSALYTLHQENNASHGVFNFENTQLVFTEDPIEHSSMWFLVTGITHVLLGIDHLVYLVLMLLPLYLSYQGDAKSRLYKQLVIYISCFTIAHSITLALVWFDKIPANSAIIESAIALTILWTALRLWRDHSPLSIWIVLFFGLVHGMGFANSMADFQIAHSIKISALLLFNIGIEIGQLAFVSLLLLVAAWVCETSIKKVKPFIAIGASFIGAFWLIERSIGYYL